MKRCANVLVRYSLKQLVYAKVAQLVEYVSSNDRLFYFWESGFESHYVLIFFLLYFVLFCLG